MPTRVIAHAEATGLTAVERRDELAHLNIQGPRSRDLLAALTDTDVVQRGVPVLHVQGHVTVAGVPDVFINRMGYTAELGYELFVAADAGGRSL